MIRKTLLVFGFLMVVTGFSILGILQAGEVESGPNVAIKAGEVIDDDLFIAGDTVTINGTVNGDVYAVGKQIRVTGIINGDLLAAAQTIDVSGTISQDLRLAAQTVNIGSASVGDGVTVLADTATFDQDSTINGGVIFAGSTLVSNAPIGHGLTAAGGTITINNTVIRPVRVQVERLILESKANVLSGITYQSENDLSRREGSRVAGDINHRMPGEKTVNWLSNWSASFVRMFLIWSYLSTILVGLVLLLVMSRHISLVSDKINDKFWPTMGLGALALLVVGPIIVLLAITVLGIPLALLLLALLIVLLYLSKIFVGLAFGRWLFRLFVKDNTPNRYVSFVVGLSALYLLKLVPLVNGLVMLATILLGIGAVLSVLYNSLFTFKPVKKTATSAKRK